MPHRTPLWIWTVAGSVQSFDLLWLIFLMTICFWTSTEGNMLHKAIQEYVTYTTKWSQVVTAVQILWQVLHFTLVVQIKHKYLVRFICWLYFPHLLHRKEIWVSKWKIIISLLFGHKLNGSPHALHYGTGLGLNALPRHHVRNVAFMCSFHVRITAVLEVC